jgi:hypothetical protein
VISYAAAAAANVPAADRLRTKRVGEQGEYGNADEDEQ